MDEMMADIRASSSSLSAPQIVKWRAVAHALAAGVEALARERHCTAIHTNLIRPRDTAPAGGGLVDVLCTRGHRIETFGMCKLLPPRSPPGRGCGPVSPKLKTA